MVVTGGEPLLQREVTALTLGLQRQGHHVTVETAGTVFREVGCDLLSLSPEDRQLGSARSWLDRHRARRGDLEPARQLLRRSPEHQVKLVVRGEVDLPELVAMVEGLGVDTGAGHADAGGPDRGRGGGPGGAGGGPVPAAGVAVRPAPAPGAVRRGSGRVGTGGKEDG